MPTPTFWRPALHLSGCGRGKTPIVSAQGEHFLCDYGIIWAVQKRHSAQSRLARVRSLTALWLRRPVCLCSLPVSRQHADSSSFGSFIIRWRRFIPIVSWWTHEQNRGGGRTRMYLRRKRRSHGRAQASIHNDLLRYDVRRGVRGKEDAGSGFPYLRSGTPQFMRAHKCLTPQESRRELSLAPVGRDGVAGNSVLAQFSTERARQAELFFAFIAAATIPGCWGPKTLPHSIPYHAAPVPAATIACIFAASSRFPWLTTCAGGP
jgi:hypothetical protein